MKRNRKYKLKETENVWINLPSCVTLRWILSNLAHWIGFHGEGREREKNSSPWICWTCRNNSCKRRYFCPLTIYGKNNTKKRPNDLTIQINWRKIYESGEKTRITMTKLKTGATKYDERYNHISCKTEMARIKKWKSTHTHTHAIGRQALTTKAMQKLVRNTAGENQFSKR